MIVGPSVATVVPPPPPVDVPPVPPGPASRGPPPTAPAPATPEAPRPSLLTPAHDAINTAAITRIEVDTFTRSLCLSGLAVAICAHVPVRNSGVFGEKRKLTEEKTRT